MIYIHRVWGYRRIMDNKTRAVVRINGTEYVLKGYETEEYIHKVAIYVDKKMQKIAENNPKLSTSMISVLAALNLADEFIKLKEEHDKLKKQFASLQENQKSNYSAKIDIPRRNRR